MDPGSVGGEGPGKEGFQMDNEKQVWSAAAASPQPDSLLWPRLVSSGQAWGSDFPRRITAMFMAEYRV